MTTITTLLPLLPMRYEASHRSEQVSQLLFGEKADIIEENNGWAYITTQYDQYSGWVEINSLTESDLKQSYGPIVILAQPLFGIENNEEIIYLPAGSELSVNTKTGSIEMGGLEYKIPPDKKHKPFEIGKSPTETACRFLNAPYLWGGRTILGFDCSGFSQIVYKLHGKYLPRDAKDQANEGSPVEFIQEALPGDLVFFDNEESEITHVGIYMGQNQIIHASVSVHIDRVDQQGIFNEKSRKYTHKLRLIKRVVG